MPTESHEAKIKRLEAKLELAIYYLKRFDMTYRVHGFDYTPEGWDITLRELVDRLEPDASEPPN